MMKILGWMLGLLVVSIALVSVAGLLSPRTIAVEESLRVGAPPETVFEAVTDLEAWQEWEPWAFSDESYKVRFGEQRRGVGASYRWSGERTGQGTMEIVAADPPTRVDYRLVFNDDEAAPATSSILLERLGPAATEVTWTFEADLGVNPLSRVLGLLLRGGVRQSYETGLANLKRYAESLPATADPSTAPGVGVD